MFASIVDCCSHSLIYSFIPLLLWWFELSSTRRERASERERESVCMSARAQAHISASTFSIDIQIIAYSLASTPSRLMRLDRHTSSNFIVVNVLPIFIFSHSLLYFLLTWRFLFFLLHSLNGAFESTEAKKKYIQETVSIIETNSFHAIFVISHPPQI